MAPNRALASLHRLGLLVLLLLAAALGVKVAATELWPYAPRLGPLPRVAGLIGGRRSVADLLAQEPAPSEIVEVDAYYSGAGRTAAKGNLLPSGEGPCPADAYAILSDEPFLPELFLLGETQPNLLPDDAPWLAVTTPAAQGTPARPQLPYFARFRGRLSQAPPSAECPAGAWVLTVERVVRVYAERPPSPPQAGERAWPRYREVEAGYSVPHPPGWRPVRPDSSTLALHPPQWPGYPVTVRIHPGETHHDPYDPTAAPRLLREQEWSSFAQSSALGRAGAAEGLVGYRLDRDVAPAERSATVLFSAHGKTYELTLRYPLGFAAPQPLLTAYSAIVARFRFAAPPGPSPTPPVRQALGPGPFLGEEEALEVGCQRLDGQIESYEARILSEAEARRLASTPTAFTGHYDGIWVLNVSTPRADNTGTMRLFLDALTGRELLNEEIDPALLPTATPMPAGCEPPAFREREVSGRAARWIEVILAEQTLIAWEGDVAVRRMRVSTGKAHTPTIRGTFHIYYKVVSTTMQGPGYHLPAVPHTMLFQHEGYAIHGTYWHSNFGAPMSRGCVNLSRSDAAWLFDWAGPELPEGAWGVEATPCNQGTKVVVR
jgi:lipoprotein-anchoring transpeptidase ErfK/SrfK